MIIFRNDKIEEQAKYNELRNRQPPPTPVCNHEDNASDATEHSPKPPRFTASEDGKNPLKDDEEEKEHEREWTC
jgi:hypothetical protein